jgi:ribosomal protein S15
VILKSTDKSEIIDKFKIHEKDTGSSNVQVALLTKRINAQGPSFKKRIIEDGWSEKAPFELCKKK